MRTTEFSFEVYGGWIYGSVCHDVCDTLAADAEDVGDQIFFSLSHSV